MKGKSDGSLIQKIYFPSDGYASSQVSCSKTVEIILQNEFHGEYDIDWAIVKRDGAEIVRHNLKYIQSIVWKEEGK